LIKDIAILEKVQRRATRMIEECKGKAYTERLEMVGLTTLETRRLRADLIEVFKIIKGYEDLDERIFFKRQDSVTRGHSLKLYKETVYKDVSKFSFGHRVINEWNKLPEEVVNATGINSFKTKIDKLLRSKWGSL
jgi:hypothetical protein